MIVQHSSKSGEHYTPPAIIEPARRVLEVIELDPASSKLANTVVQARRIFTRKDNGLHQLWRGRTWCNPPGGLVDNRGREVIRGVGSGKPCSETGACGLRPGHKHQGVASSAVVWWDKLASEWAAGGVESAIFLGFTLEILQRGQKAESGLTPLDFPFCVVADRIKFLGERNGKLVPGRSPTHANVVIHLPRRQDRTCSSFREAFSPIGKVVVP